MYQPEFWENWIRSQESDNNYRYIDKDEYHLTISTQSASPFSNKVRYLRTYTPEKTLQKVIQFYTDLGKSFLLVIMDHTEIKEIHELVKSNGFKLQDTYYRMVSSVDKLLQKRGTDQYEVRKVSPQTLLNEDHLQISLTNFPDYFNSLQDVRNMVKRLIDIDQSNTKKEIHHFVAYTSEKQPVASSSLSFYYDLPSGTELSGASVLPEYREKGIYSALLHERAKFSREHNRNHLFVIANSNTSAPIVKKLGFQEIETFYDYIYMIE